MDNTSLDPTSIPALQPAHALWKRYRPERAPFAFHATTEAEARGWQERTREALREILGLAQWESAPLRPKLLETVDRGDHVREKVLLRTSSDTLMPVYLLLPKAAPRPVPVVLAFHLGMTVPGMRVHDGMRLVDYLAERPELDSSRLGAMGISGGGMHTLFSTCVDTRIRACVISGYFSTFRDSILAMHHCACNFVPGLGRFGEMYDLAGLIAPRPMLVESGSYDPIFPRRAVERSVARTRRVYGTFAARERLDTDYFEGRHEISGRKAYTFLRDCLSAQ